MAIRSIFLIFPFPINKLMKNVLLLILLVFVPTVQLFAQNITADSLKIKTKLAQADARKFKPTKEIRNARRKRLLLNSSDYFKPTAATVSNPKLLSDSVYVRAYKDAAYNKSVHNGKTGYYAVVSAKIVGGAIIVGTLFILLFVAFLRQIKIY